MAKEEFVDRLHYRIVDIDEPRNKEWWDNYCFDVPVLHIEDANSESLYKVFHRFNDKDVSNKIKLLL